MLLGVLPEFRISTRVHLGDGSSTSFWYDHWISHLPLAEAFPALLSHCLRPNVTVAAAWNGLAWDLFLCTRLSANATQEYTVLTEALALVQPSTEADRRGIGPAMAPYSSKLAYSWNMDKHPDDLFAAYIWNNAATPRCKHFLWLGHRERIPSAALLHRRHIIDNDFCAYCGAYEDQHHILLRCPRARRIWRLLN